MIKTKIHSMFDCKIIGAYKNDTLLCSIVLDTQNSQAIVREHVVMPLMTLNEQLKMICDIDKDLKESNIACDYGQLIPILTGAEITHFDSNHKILMGVNIPEFDMDSWNSIKILFELEDDRCYLSKLVLNATEIASYEHHRYKINGDYKGVYDITLNYLINEGICIDDTHNTEITYSSNYIANNVTHISIMKDAYNTETKGNGVTYATLSFYENDNIIYTIDIVIDANGRLLLRAINNDEIDKFNLRLLRFHTHSLTSTEEFSAIINNEIDKSDLEMVLCSIELCMPFTYRYEYGSKITGQRFTRSVNIANYVLRDENKIQLSDYKEFDLALINAINAI